MTTATVDFVFVESKIRKWQWVKKLLLSAILKEFRLTIYIGANETAVCDWFFFVCFVIGFVGPFRIRLCYFFCVGQIQSSVGVMCEGVMYIIFSAFLVYFLLIHCHNFWAILCL